MDAGVLHVGDHARRGALYLLIFLAAWPWNAEARALRDPAQVRAFRADNPCPATGRTRGACPGWQVDHIVPLCAGGPDRPENLQWLRTEDHRMKTFLDTRQCRRDKALPNP